MKVLDKMFPKKAEEKAKEDAWKGAKEIIDRIFKDTEDRRKAMTKNLKAFRGEIWDKSKLKSWDSSAVYNLLFTTVSSVAPLITDSKPISIVVPREPWNAPLAEAYTEALAYEWDVMGTQMLLNKWVVWALICGEGLTRLYYCPIKKSIQEEIVDPRDFFIAPGYEQIEKAPFCGTRGLRPVSWVKQNFPDAEIKEDVQSYTMDDDDEPEKSYKYSDVSSIEADYLFVRVYELWSRDDAEIKGPDGEMIKEFPHGKLWYFTDTQELGVKKVMDEHGEPPYVKIDDYYNPGS
jgi:hypothetical protein